jgi:hypothetical protein
MHSIDHRPGAKNGNYSSGSDRTPVFLRHLATARGATGYRLALLAIDDAQVVATSGKTHHPIASRSGAPTDCVPGAVLVISLEELRQADGYEVAAYRRERVTLASGMQAWAYVDARDAAP